MVFTDINPNERRRSKWNGTTVTEMKAFLGIMIFFGLHWVPEIQLYWAKHPCFGHLLVKRTFSRDRFKLLLRYLYYTRQPYCRPGDDKYRHQKRAEKQDRMLKVRPVIDRINENSRRHRNPERDLAVDEGVVAYRGRSTNVTYNPAKPHKYGLRVYTLSELSTGYVFNDKVHQTPQASKIIIPIKLPSVTTAELTG